MIKQITTENLEVGSEVCVMLTRYGHTEYRMRTVTEKTKAGIVTLEDKRAFLREEHRTRFVASGESMERFPDQHYCLIDKDLAKEELEIQFAKDRRIASNNEMKTILYDLNLRYNVPATSEQKARLLELVQGL